MTSRLAERVSEPAADVEACLSRRLIIVSLQFANDVGVQVQAATYTI